MGGDYNETQVEPINLSIFQNKSLVLYIYMCCLIKVEFSFLFLFYSHIQKSSLSWRVIGRNGAYNIFTPSV